LQGFLIKEVKTLFVKPTQGKCAGKITPRYAMHWIVTIYYDYETLQGLLNFVFISRKFK